MVMIKWEIFEELIHVFRLGSSFIIKSWWWRS
jgi:hypothetical protein